MTIRNARSMFGAWALWAAMAAGCAPGAADTSSDGTEDPNASETAEDIAGTNAVGRKMSVDGYVLVRTSATTADITSAVKSQMRVLFGAARNANIGLGERNPIINTASFRRDNVTVVDTANPSATARPMLRVRYTYRTNAVVPRAIADASTVQTVTLYGNYNAYASDVIHNCQAADTQNLTAATIWYHFDPAIATCQSSIGDETARIEDDRRKLTDADHQVTALEAARRYLPLTLHLVPIASNEAAYPEYNRLYDDNQFVAYSFFGLDQESDPYDYGGKNYFTFLRAMTEMQPALHVTGVTGGVNLLAVSWQGQSIPGVTYERIQRWILDDTDYPEGLSYWDRSSFRLQILRQWRGHYVTLGMTANVTTRGVTRTVPIEIRTYYGDEEGAAAAGAVRRYKLAFGAADVFQYTGHSHLGFGPLDPANYRTSDFPNRYQILMANSCVSFNYYNQFFGMHPGGSRNLDTISNGIEVYLEGAGLSSARFMNGLIDGRFRSYLDVLQDMHLDLPWASDYDPERVVDGELDNAFTPAAYNMSLSAQ